jgi:very-short-patch-repair endonuclease
MPEPVLGRPAPGLETSGGQTAETVRLPAEFLAKDVHVGLERIRVRLLDLTNRNRLVNFRHSPRSSLRFVDLLPDEVFDKLLDQEKVPIEPVSEPPTDQETDAKNYAESQGWSTSYDLPLSVDHRGKAPSGALPTLHYPEDLDGIARRIASAARTSIEESGINMLYLVFGFLQWYEADQNDQEHYAPLLMVPVSWERDPFGRFGPRSYLEYSGEDVAENLSLRERLRVDFGLELPPLEDEDRPGSYFEKVREAVASKPRWSVQCQVTLAMLSFAKLLMYRDLDPQNRAVTGHPRIRDLFEGTRVESTVAEEYCIDRIPQPPLLIHDADSSQHSALIDALSGKSLVIDGPPGTGKSQTITNLIAASLANGKTVLFVSEKLAALEVVKHRLDQAGLGDFCLELHSHKTKKLELLSNLEQRIGRRGAYGAAGNLEHRQDEVNRTKRHLTEYADLINKPFGGQDLSIFQIIWAYERRRQELLCDPALLDSLFLPNAEGWSKGEFYRKQHTIEIFARHAQEALVGRVSLQEHPCYGVENVHLTYLDEQVLIRTLLRVDDRLSHARDCAAHLRTVTGWQAAETLTGLLEAIALCGRLPTPQGRERWKLLPHLSDRESAAKVESFIQALDDWRAERAYVGERITVLALLNDAIIIQRVRAACREAVRRKIADYTAAGLGDRIDKVRAMLDRLERAGAFFRDISGAFIGESMVLTLGCAVTLTRCLQVLDRAPWAELPLRNPCLEAEQAFPTIQKAAEQAKSLVALRGTLEARFDLKAAAPPAELQRHACALRESGFWGRIFGSDYRAAKRAFRRVSLHKRRCDRHEMAGNLRDLAEFHDQIHRFRERKEYQEVLGPHFEGIDTPWDQVLRLAGWYRLVQEALPNVQTGAARFRQALLCQRAQELKAVHEMLQKRAGDRTGFEAVIGEMSGQAGIQASQDLSTFAGQARDWLSAVCSILETLAPLRLRKDVPIREIPALLDQFAQLQSKKTAVEQDQSLRALLGECFYGVETDTAPLRLTVRLASSLRQCEIPEPLKRWLFSDEFPTRLSNLDASLLKLDGAVQDLEKASTAAIDLGKLNVDLWSPREAPLIDLSKRIQHAVADAPALSAWMNLVRARDAAQQADLQNLIDLVEKGQIQPSQLPGAFGFVFYNSLLRRVLEEHPLLMRFNRLTHEEVRRAFAEADQESIKLYRQHVANLTDRRSVPWGNSTGPVGTWSNLPLLIREISKQRRHLPIRQLMRRAGAAIQSLKPCFMMGPLSVAQYLALDQLRFDVVVMDEASQLKPEDALGAIARASQLVVVGDPKQLPPTSFFQRFNLDSTDEIPDDQTAAEDAKSILEVAGTVYQPVRRLRWHYRSKHHSLIAFSNREFYNGDLIVFPSAYDHSPDLGIRYRPVQRGVFENRRNPVEARLVIDAILDHAQNRPKESLGVVTLNFEQREMIEDMLENRLRADPFARRFVETMYEREEPLFIKNLENVQGDERDVIFISVTYGPDANGTLYQRFGPINTETGWRRLNVLFTRAKKRVVVFSSLEPDLIRVEPGRWSGVPALKAYLAFAKTGILAQFDANPERPSNDFEMSVATVIRQRGFEVVPQVGVAGYFIDLAVRHPQKPGKFILGIECDGATYHSARSARDRDRLREGILRDQGWKIHRVWSTDWLRNRSGEVNRLFARIEELLVEEGPVPTAPPPLEHRIEDARKRLEELRQEIAMRFPDAPAEKCLLRTAVLEELLQKRPTDRDEWFRRIPRQLREGTDSRQIAEYLSSVLEILADV